MALGSSEGLYLLQLLNNSVALSLFSISNIFKPIQGVLKTIQGVEHIDKQGVYFLIVSTIGNSVIMRYAYIYALI
jgi:hypothetical protein